MMNIGEKIQKQFTMCKKSESWVMMRNLLANPNVCSDLNIKEGGEVRD